MPVIIEKRSRYSKGKVALYHGFPYARARLSKTIEFQGRPHVSSSTNITPSSCPKFSWYKTTSMFHDHCNIVTFSSGVAIPMLLLLNATRAILEHANAWAGEPYLRYDEMCACRPWATFQGYRSFWTFRRFDALLVSWCPAR